MTILNPHRESNGSLSRDMLDKMGHPIAPDQQFLINDFTTQDTWRVFRIMSEFVEGFETLRKVGPAVSIFGSARTTPGDPDYVMAQKLAHRCVECGYAVITGGGPGIMEAANRGASEAGGISVGLNIELPFEQKPNSHIGTLVSFRYFFCRKVMFVKYSSAFVILPGGFGTLDELFESITLIQTKKIKPFPVILVDRRYWDGLLRWLREDVLPSGKISLADMEIFKTADSIDDIVKLILETRIPESGADSTEIALPRRRKSGKLR